MAPMTITADEVRRLLDYDPETGVFTRLVRTSNRICEGDVAGCLSDSGYWLVRVGGRRYPAHRLAWLYAYDEWPRDEIDHIDRDRANNRLSNLRQATRRENAQNLSLSCKNTSGVTGVSWDAQRAKWCVRLRLNRRKLHFGRFTCYGHAVRARRVAEIAHHPFKAR